MTTSKSTVVCVAVFGLVISTGLAAQAANVETFEDCLLENMPKAQTDVAARAILAACRMKLPKEKETLNLEEFDERYSPTTAPPPPEGFELIPPD